MNWKTCVLLASMLASGCATEKMSGDQLARVAKDWSLSIRASQVIPVYPLTEDLQPGDVFLVQTPVEDQVKVYLEKGFLPLENLVTRLALTGYAQFYNGYPMIGGANDPAPPRPWQFPANAAGTSDFSLAPLAAFPSYGFSVSRSGGLSVAIPVQAVPVGLNLMDSASANGTITLKDAYTYALPARTTYEAIQRWSRDNSEYLSQFEPATETKNGKTTPKEFYLRVINRVYLVKTVDVSLFSNRGFGASGSAGVPQPVQLLNIANATEAAKQFDAINQILSKSTPTAGAVGTPAGAAAGPAVGGSLKVAMATSRSVSLVETFHRPLVIGYLATDYKILSDGMLAAPLPTLNVLEGRGITKGTPIKYTGCDENCNRFRGWRREPGNLAKLEAWLEQKGGGISVADFETGDHAALRQAAANDLIDAHN